MWSTKGHATRLAALLVVCAAYLLSAPTRAEPASATDLGKLLYQSANWTYQLQGAKPRELASTNFDVIVIDAFFGGGPREIRKLKTMPFGQRRIVLAYLSIGEAEVYRYYWPVCCARGQRPAWIGPENKRWPGNYRVEFWNDEWKSIIFEDTADSYLKKIIDLGFDGVYLDRIDVHNEFSSSRRIDNRTPRAQMIRFVIELQRVARRLKKDFLIVAQNAEELLSDDAYLAAIDGIAKEDLLFGVRAEGKRNETPMITFSVGQLRRAHAAGKHVMAVEYLKDPATIEAARTEILELGFVPYIAPRDLSYIRQENLVDEDTH